MANKQHIDILRSFISEFGILSNEEIQLILDNTVVASYKKGDYLLREGEVSTKCYFVLKGCIRQYYLIDGEEKTTNFFTEQDPVNSFTSNVNKTPSRSNLICAEDCVVTVGTDDLQKEMCKQIPRLESIILNEVEKNTGKLQDDYAKFITSSPEKRYKNLLDQKPHLINRVPHHQIASYLGMTPESLSRIKKRIFTKKSFNLTKLKQRLN
ncbi:Crp/Fnr family transcriptional regulator [Candidatus Kapabacteria bacterium]|nr:Crp/Fnr family transcriptional regulator [Candidatus Kapabacteria bacterium]